MKSITSLCAVISFFAIGLLTSDVTNTLAECNDAEECDLTILDECEANGDGVFTFAENLDRLELEWNLTDDPHLAGCSVTYGSFTINIVTDSVGFQPSVLFPSSCTGSQTFDVEGELSDPDSDGTIEVFGFTSGPNCTTSSTLLHVNH